MKMGIAISEQDTIRRTTFLFSETERHQARPALLSVATFITPAIVRNRASAIIASDATALISAISRPTSSEVGDRQLSDQSVITNTNSIGRSVNQIRLRDL